MEHGLTPKNLIWEFHWFHHWRPTKSPSGSKLFASRECFFPSVPTSGIRRVSTASRCSWAQSQAITCSSRIWWDPGEHWWRCDDVIIQDWYWEIMKHIEKKLIFFFAFDEISITTKYITKLFNTTLWYSWTQTNLGKIKMMEMDQIRPRMDRYG